MNVCYRCSYFIVHTSVNTVFLANPEVCFYANEALWITQTLAKFQGKGLVCH